MQCEAAPEQIERYRRDGFLVIENFLDSGELARWKSVTEEAIADRMERTRAGSNEAPGNVLDDESFYARVFMQALRLADTYLPMRELIYDPRLGRLAATLEGISGIRVWHDQALFKPAFGNPTAWHLDNPYWSFTSQHAISIWIALDDATLANGCMWYVPGSHKTARNENVGIGPNQDALFKVYPEWRSIDPVGCPCAAGSAVFHNGLTAHGAGANMTNKPRRAMTCGFMPDGSTFNGTRNILPEPYFSTLKIGDVLDNDEFNPLVWSDTTR